MKRTTFGLLVLVVVLAVSTLCSCTSFSKSGQHYAQKEQRKADSLEIESNYYFWYWIESSTTTGTTTILVSLRQHDRSNNIVSHFIDATNLSAKQQADSLLYYEAKYDTLRRVMVMVDMRELGY